MSALATLGGVLSLQSLLAAQVMAAAEDACDMIETSAQPNGSLGNPKEVLTAAGNGSDIGLTTAAWTVCIIPNVQHPNGRPDWYPSSPAVNAKAAEDFLDTYRDTDTVAQAAERVSYSHELLAAAIMSMSDNDLMRTVNITFYGNMSVYQAISLVISHALLHTGQGEAIGKQLRAGAVPWKAPATSA